MLIHYFGAETQGFQGFVILECRITLCYKTISQIRKRVIASVESKRVATRGEPNTFCILCISNTDWSKNRRDRGLCIYCL